MPKLGPPSPEEASIRPARPFHQTAARTPWTPRLWLPASLHPLFPSPPSNGGNSRDTSIACRRRLRRVDPAGRPGRSPRNDPPLQPAGDLAVPPSRLHRVPTCRRRASGLGAAPTPSVRTPLNGVNRERMSAEGPRAFHLRSGWGIRHLGDRRSTGPRWRPGGRKAGPTGYRSTLPRSMLRDPTTGPTPRPTLQPPQPSRALTAVGRDPAG